MGILEKYRQAEGYDLPSASFVYPDARREEEDREAVRELAAHLSFINRIHISYLNQSYERNYYWNMRLRCEQLFPAAFGQHCLLAGRLGSFGKYIRSWPGSGGCFRPDC